MDRTIEEAIESVIEGWYPDGRIDMDDLVDRVEILADVDLGGDLLSPQIRQIKAYARKYQRRER